MVQIADVTQCSRKLWPHARGSRTLVPGLRSCVTAAWLAVHRCQTHMCDCAWAQHVKLRESAHLWHDLILAEERRQPAGHNVELAEVAVKVHLHRTVRYRPCPSRQANGADARRTHRRCTGLRQRRCAGLVSSDEHKGDVRRCVPCSRGASHSWLRSDTKHYVRCYCEGPHATRSARSGWLRVVRRRPQWKACVPATLNRRRGAP